MLLMMEEEHYDQFSPCPSLLSSLFFTLFYPIEEGRMLQKGRTFCSFLFASFLYSVSFAPLSLCLSRLLIVGFFKSLFVALLIVHAHIRLQTQCAKANNDNDQVKHIHSVHNVIISVNYRHNYNRHYSLSYLSVIIICMCIHIFFCFNND